MKNRIKQLAVMVVFAFATQHIMAQEENGYVKVFEDFKEQYIGAANNQHLFYEVNRKNPIANSIKFYNEDMKFIKEEKVPFDMSTSDFNNLLQGEYSRVITSNDMLLVSRIVSKEEGKLASYAYDEISWYDLNDLSKPKYTQQIKRLPNFPMMTALTYRKYLNNFYPNNKTIRFVSEDRVAFLFETEFERVGGAKKIGYEDMDNENDHYLVVMDNELNILFEGFIKVADKLKEGDGLFKDKVKGFFVANNEVIIHSLRNINALYSYKRNEKINHFTIEGKSEIVTKKIKIARAFGDKHYDKFLFTLSPDGTFLSSSYYSHRIVEGEKMEWKSYGTGICKYDITNKKINSLYELPFDEEKMIPIKSVLQTNYIVKNDIIAQIQIPFKSSTYSNLNFDFLYKFVSVNQDGELLSVMNVPYLMDAHMESVLYVSNMNFFYDAKNESLNLLYMNSSMSKKVEDELVLNESKGLNSTKMYKSTIVWEGHPLTDKLGSHIFQLTYIGNGKWKKSTIDFPEEMKYRKKEKTNGVKHMRSKFFTLNNYSSYRVNNTRNSCITMSTNGALDVINVIKLNK